MYTLAVLLAAPLALMVASQLPRMTKMSQLIDQKVKHFQVVFTIVDWESRKYNRAFHGGPRTSMIT
ncbi:hypothetical protein M404DRAFT_994919 [Pisolithus tinctorius Marx 270]|uniref:Uncharacterized protein n=1 Tax=Pisolithus tinctorius Marx 270 TaxID=870435 RepID=A0A0C3PBZ3_PISTI|nr:hypothetical protein M404DRAFT_994919 [Pisolithus tinctorius Marx 270]